MSMFLVEGRNPHETRGQYVLSIEAAVAIMEEMKQDFQKVKIYEKVDGEYVTSVRWEREMTNEEWLETLTTKKKAEQLCIILPELAYENDGIWDAKIIEEWLKEKHKE